MRFPLLSLVLLALGMQESLATNGLQHLRRSTDSKRKEKELELSLFEEDREAWFRLLETAASMSMLPAQPNNLRRKVIEKKEQSYLIETEPALDEDDTKFWSRLLDGGSMSMSIATQP